MQEYDPTRLDLLQPKKTLGQEIYEVHNKHAGQKTQTVRETTNEMGKEYMASLRKVLEQNSSVKGDFYIMEIMRPDSHLDGVIRLYHIARRTRPKPEWGTALYKRNNENETLTYEYGLPHVAEAERMLREPYGWDEKVMRDIKDMQAGKLE